MWLVILRHDTTLNMKDLASQLGYGKVVIRFGDAKSLLENLGTAQGHVSPFALVNDTKLVVQVAVDAAIVAGGETPFLFHPLVNEASVGLTGDALGTFVQRTGHTFVTVQGE
jgi:Ala-tRNA(Pro) deacylase